MQDQTNFSGTISHSFISCDSKLFFFTFLHVIIFQLREFLNDVMLNLTCRSWAGENNS